MNQIAKLARAPALGAMLIGAAPVPSAMQLGVTTHFSQGWPQRLIGNAVGVGAITIRDSLHWRKAEQVAGTIKFDATNSSHISAACAAGLSVLLVIQARNPLYDKGQSLTSIAGRAAFANYVLAIADRFKGCVEAIEIDNEVNGAGGLVGVVARDRPQTHVALLRSVYTLVKPRHPELQLLGGSTNTIATGFLESLFKLGALDVVDGIVVHPYRRDAEGVDWELDRLKAAMMRAGQIKPIWATEFSREFASPADAPDFLLKMVAQMSAAGLPRAYWYALIDQSYFPTMGLETQKGLEKPAARAFRTAANLLRAHGDAVRVETGDATLYHFRFGNSVDLVWGTRRALRLSASAAFRNAQGEPIARPEQVSESPVIIERAQALSFGSPEILAESRIGFAQPPFSYFARRANQQIVPLNAIDWQYTTYLGNSTARPIKITRNAMSLLGSKAHPVENVVRFTATQSGAAYAQACLMIDGVKGDGVSFEIRHNGRVLAKQLVGLGAVATLVSAPMVLANGDAVDFVTGPNRNALGDLVKYRFIVTRSLQDKPTC